MFSMWSPNCGCSPDSPKTPPEVPSKGLVADTVAPEGVITKKSRSSFPAHVRVNLGFPSSIHVRCTQTSLPARQSGLVVHVLVGGLAGDGVGPGGRVAIGAEVGGMIGARVTIGGGVGS